MNWFLYMQSVSFEWAKHGERCQRNTILINVLYFILRSFEFIRFRIFYYVFKVVLKCYQNMMARKVVEFYISELFCSEHYIISQIFPL